MQFLASYTVSKSESNMNGYNGGWYGWKVGWEGDGEYCSGVSGGTLTFVLRFKFPSTAHKGTLHSFSIEKLKFSSNPDVIWEVSTTEPSGPPSVSATTPTAGKIFGGTIISNSTNASLGASNISHIIEDQWYYLWMYNPSSWVNRISDETPFTIKYSYTPNDYTITYNNNGGSGNISTQIVSYGSNFTVNNGNSFTKEGYHFTGWKTASGDAPWTVGQTYTWTYTNDQYGISDNNVTLYAQWDANHANIYENATNGFKPYDIYIYNGSSWNDQYVPFIWDGSKWVPYN